MFQLVRALFRPARRRTAPKAWPIEARNVRMAPMSGRVTPASSFSSVLRRALSIPTY
jgi:hypothetical protein